jgi:GAF domain-containing protein
MSSDASTQALNALSRFLVAQSSMGETLHRVTEITTQAIPRSHMAGITLLGDDGKPRTGVFTDDDAPEIDSAQYESGRGPCLDSWRLTRVIRLDDMEKATVDYPEFAKAAQGHGILSTLSLPLIAGEQGIGALNLYSRARAGFTTEDEEVGQQLAAAAAIVLANASAYWGASQLSEQLSEAMRSRAVIEQAKGMLMARSPQMTADDAFELLRKASQRENVKLRDIAQRIVERKASDPIAHAGGKA